MPPFAPRTVRTTVVLAVAAISAGLVSAPGPASASPSAPAPAPKRVGPPTVKTVTLVTGDVVKVSTASDGRQSVTLQPRPDVMNLDEPEMLSRLEEQVDRYLAARDVLAERLLALRPRAVGGP